MTGFVIQVTYTEYVIFHKSHFKEIVLPKMKIRSSHLLNVIPRLYDLLSFVEHNGRYI